MTSDFSVAWQFLSKRTIFLVTAPPGHRSFKLFKMYIDNYKELLPSGIVCSCHRGDGSYLRVVR
jgi:hypothetical protein